MLSPAAEGGEKVARSLQKGKKATVNAKEKGPWIISVNIEKEGGDRAEGFGGKEKKEIRAILCYRNVRAGAYDLRWREGGTTPSAN